MTNEIMPKAVFVSLTTAVCAKIQEFEDKRKTAINDGHKIKLDGLIANYKSALDWITEQRIEGVEKP